MGWGRSGRAQRSTNGDVSDGDFSGDADGGRGGAGGADLGRESENEDADRWVAGVCVCVYVWCGACGLCVTSLRRVLEYSFAVELPPSPTSTPPHPLPPLPPSSFFPLLHRTTIELFSALFCSDRPPGFSA